MLAYAGEGDACGKGAMRTCDEAGDGAICWCGPAVDPFADRPELCKSSARVVSDPYGYRAMSPFPADFYTRVAFELTEDLANGLLDPAAGEDRASAPGGPARRRAGV